MKYNKNTRIDWNEITEILTDNVCNGGILIDTDKAEEIYTELMKRCEELDGKAREELIEEYRGINLASNKDIQKVMINQFGFQKYSRKSKSGNYSFGAEILEYIISQTGNKFCTYLKNLRSSKSIASKVIEIVNYVDSNDFVYPTLKYTETSRAMFVEPGLSNMHEIVRPIIAAPKGYVMITGDYSQQEPYILTNMLNIKQFKEGIGKGEDFYRVMVRELTGEELKDEDRDLSKMIWLAGTYGSELNNANFNRYQREFAERVKNEINELEEINEFKMYLKETVIRGGENIKSYFGTEREVPSYIKNANKLERIVFNNTIQTTGADMIALALMECTEWFKEKGYDSSDIRIYFTLYDAITFLVKEELMDEELVEELEDKMTLDIDGWTKIGIKFKTGSL